MLDSFSSASVHSLTRMVSPFSAFSSAVTRTCVLVIGFGQLPIDFKTSFAPCVLYVLFE